VDFDAGTVTANGTITQVKGQGAVRKDKPKTDASRRTMKLPAYVMAVLAERTLRVDTDRYAPVFPGRGGTWRHPHNVRTQWRQVRAAIGYDWVTPHTFRKTVATLVDKQAGSKTAADVLGHTSDEVTKAHYIVQTFIAPDVSAILDQLAPAADADGLEDAS
jgi:integrase